MIEPDPYHRHHLLAITSPRSERLAHFGARDIGWQALGPAIACAILSTAVVGLRWYTRARLVRCLGWDDYVILLSLILSWTMTALIAAAVAYGIGTYPSTTTSSTNSSTSPSTIQKTLSLITILIVSTNNLWALTVSVTKASILMQYLRIFSNPRVRILCYCLLAALLPAVLWAVLGGTLLCRPVSKLWDPAVKAGRCMSAEKYWTGDLVQSGVWNITWSAVEANVGIFYAVEFRYDTAGVAGIEKAELLFAAPSARTTEANGTRREGGSGSAGNAASVASIATFALN
ncbi:hypothetical protein KC332_g1260 [Hortaea werneckii]|nr:hypothetical protein KC350_g1397 [Hortaea werneckii]KAI6943585.1 hypothetical protein KC341_g1390 [Hortaea werneckii]KAI6951091.1 hypothetical protein KC348_g279 [Hortaea werneckii]KAI6981634.1 hypothetical protein KC321_g1115 [Hortaea werneckii]KAI6996968.1 hypothetical protein KC329_g1807 [Hortaea werneckii]